MNQGGQICVCQVEIWQGLVGKLMEISFPKRNTDWCDGN